MPVPMFRLELKDNKVTGQTASWGDVKTICENLRENLFKILSQGFSSDRNLEKTCRRKQIEISFTPTTLSEQSFVLTVEEESRSLLQVRDRGEIKGVLPPIYSMLFFLQNISDEVADHLRHCEKPVHTWISVYPEIPIAAIVTAVNASSFELRLEPVQPAFLRAGLGASHPGLN